MEAAEAPELRFVAPQPCPWIDRAGARGIVIGPAERPICAAGVTEGRRITLMDEDERAMSASALPHELLHVFLGDVVDDQDPGHTRPEWLYMLTMRDAIARAGF